MLPISRLNANYTCPLFQGAISVHKRGISLEKYSFRTRAFVPAQDLRKEYSQVAEQLKHVEQSAMATALTAPTFCLGWSMMTEQMPIDSPVALSSAIVGTTLFGYCMAKRYRLRRYQNLNVYRDRLGPSKRCDQNKEVLAILSDPLAKINSSGKGIEVRCKRHKLLPPVRLHEKRRNQLPLNMHKVTISQVASTPVAYQRTLGVWRHFALAIGCLAGVWHTLSIRAKSNDFEKGKLFVISGPSGVGKTTLADRLTKDIPGVIRSVSWTTREPRGAEVDGVDYVYVSRDTFQKAISGGELLEYAEIYQYFYGTNARWVDERLNQGDHVLLVIDTQGALQIKEKRGAVLVFIEPPSYQELERRLRARQSESEEDINTRLQWAKHELTLADKYDYRVVNKDIDDAYQEVKKILSLEEKILGKRSV